MTLIRFDKIQLLHTCSAWYGMVQVTFWDAMTTAYPIIHPFKKKPIMVENFVGFFWMQP